MQVLSATLVPGSETPVGVGTRGARTAVVIVNGARVRAHLKTLEHQAIVAECFAALLLDGWGLTVPQPLLVNTGTTVVFGAQSLSYPDLGRRFLLDKTYPSPLLKQLTYNATLQVCGFSETPLAIAADEAIGNGDRNLRNILWDGTACAWIDHERAFGLDGASDRNRLVEFAVSVGHNARLEAASVAAALTMDRSVASNASTRMPLDCAALSAFVLGRLPGIAQRVLARFPQPHDLFKA